MPILEEQIAETVIAGNTTMQHIFAGESCAGLGQAPFALGDIPPFSEGRPGRCPAAGNFRTLGGRCDAPASTRWESRNGKSQRFSGSWAPMAMALWDGRRLYTASTAAGPAFEGGKLKKRRGLCSGGDLRGSEESAEGVLPETIGDQRPVGICGTGAVSASLSASGGGNAGPGRNDGGTVLFPGISPLDSLQRERICLYQEDVRELQMAKSAICSGVEILMEEAALEADQIAAVYLAGGMGCALDSGTGAYQPAASRTVQKVSGRETRHRWRIAYLRERCAAGNERERGCDGKLREVVKAGGSGNTGRSLRNFRISF